MERVLQNYITHNNFVRKSILPKITSSNSHATKIPFCIQLYGSGRALYRLRNEQFTTQGAQNSIWTMSCVKGPQPHCTESIASLAFAFDYHIFNVTGYCMKLLGYCIILVCIVYYYRVCIDFSNCSADLTLKKAKLYTAKALFTVNLSVSLKNFKEITCVKKGLNELHPI